MCIIDLGEMDAPEEKEGKAEYGQRTSKIKIRRRKWRKIKRSIIMGEIIV